MKRIIEVIVFVFFCGIVYSSQDRFGNERQATWRSSFTASADRDVSISTDASIFWDVVVGTPSPNSSVIIYDSSTTIFTVALTTVSRIATDTRVQGNPYNIYLSSGLMYNKIGTAEITILWDYLYNFNRK